MSAGYTPGVPRLKVPALLMTDAGLGVTNPRYRPGDTATCFRRRSRSERASTRRWRARRVRCSAARRAPAASTWCSAAA